MYFYTMILLSKKKAFVIVIVIVIFIAIVIMSIKTLVEISSLFFKDSNIMTCVSLYIEAALNNIVNCFIAKKNIQNG